MNKSTKINNLNSFKPEKFNWKLVQSEMKNNLGPDVYESWLKKITFVDEFNNYLLLSVPTRFIRFINKSNFFKPTLINIWP